MASITAKIQGAKFFQNRLDALRIWTNNASKRNQLPASSLATYILYHFMCDDFGRILAKEFCLKHTAEQYNLPYTSLHNGHHRLISSGWILEEWINDELYYTITNYAELNNAEKNQSLNYFVIPKYLLKHAVLTPFISSRDVSGIIGLLELINSMYREFSINPIKQTLKRTTYKLLKKMKKSQRSFKQWMNRIEQLFTITILKNKQDQEQWIIGFVEGCYEEPKQDPELNRILSGIRKDITHHFTYSGLKYRKQHIQDVYFACKQELVDILYFLPNKNEVIRNLHTDAIKEVLEVLQLGIKIKTIGAYYREILRKKVVAFLKYDLDAKEKIDLHTSYHLKFQKIHRSIAEAYKNK
ncbi:hypothetical protein ACTHO0_19315 [Cytobacillus praedii]|uniref:hypothetical protein n=1 Tax=Cytobacillus praedii TaxID=1742358 RepID=UPI003F7EAA54